MKSRLDCNLGRVTYNIKVICGDIDQTDPGAIDLPSLESLI